MSRRIQKTRAVPIRRWLPGRTRLRKFTTFSCKSNASSSRPRAQKVSARLFMASPAKHNTPSCQNRSKSASETQHLSADVLLEECDFEFSKLCLAIPKRLDAGAVCGMCMQGPPWQYLCSTSKLKSRIWCEWHSHVSGWLSETECRYSCSTFFWRTIASWCMPSLKQMLAISAIALPERKNVKSLFSAF